MRSVNYAIHRSRKDGWDTKKEKWGIAISVMQGEKVLKICYITMYTQLILYYSLKNSLGGNNSCFVFCTKIYFKIFIYLMICIFKYSF
jgi:hypothetical protein